MQKKCNAILNFKDNFLEDIGENSASSDTILQGLRVAREVMQQVRCGAMGAAQLLASSSERWWQWQQEMLTQLTAV